MENKKSTRNQNCSPVKADGARPSLRTYGYIAVCAIGLAIAALIFAFRCCAAGTEPAANGGTVTAKAAEIYEAANADFQQGEIKININTAGRDELALLPGIGEELAERIVLWREENGQFISCEDIMQVPGIGTEKYSQIKDKITVSEETDENTGS